MWWLGFLIGLVVGAPLGAWTVSMLRAGTEMDDAIGSAERGGSKRS